MDAKDEMGQAIAQEISQTIARKIAAGIAKGIAIFIAFVIFIVLGGVVVQLLWNWLVPSLFGLREVTMWEALGMLTLSRILFGGFGRGGGSHSGPRHRRREWWKKESSTSTASPQAQSEPQQ